MHRVGSVLSGAPATQSTATLPSSGIGFNTSVQDSYDLAWKLAAFPSGQTGPALLDRDLGMQNEEVAEITGLMSRAENWPDGLQWIARRMKPSRRHKKNMTACERKTGWKYSVTCTITPDAGIDGVPCSHHPQFIDVLHRDHATVETDGVRTAKAMGLRNLPDTLRYRIWHIPARLVRHARKRTLKISPDWPWKDAFLTCWQRLCHLPAPG
ncbi:MAG TPA: FAD-dependent monooxygenase [Trebonia sp.]